MLLYIWRQQGQEGERGVGEGLGVSFRVLIFLCLLSWFSDGRFMWGGGGG